jgi:hypothetical protein
MLEEVPTKLNAWNRVKWCQLLAVLSLVCIVWHTVCSVEILFFGQKFRVSLVDLGETRR